MQEGRTQPENFWPRNSKSVGVYMYTALEIGSDFRSEFKEVGFGCSVSHSKSGRERDGRTWWVLVVGEGRKEGNLGTRALGGGGRAVVGTERTRGGRENHRERECRGARRRSRLGCRRRRD